MNEKAMQAVERLRAMPEEKLRARIRELVQAAAAGGSNACQERWILGGATEYVRAAQSRPEHATDRPSASRTTLERLLETSHGALEHPLEASTHVERTSVGWSAPGQRFALNDSVSTHVQDAA